MSDQVTICNLALDSIGARSEIASLTEESQEARTLSLHWQPSVNAVLQAAHWNFARKQAALTVLKAAAGTPENPNGDDPVPPVPWLYEYAVPSDCLSCRFIMPSFDLGSTPFSSAAAIPSGPAIRFLVASDEDTNGNPVNVILTNQPDALLVYTYRVSNPELFDGQFVIALSNYLGSRICIRVNGDKAMAKMAYDIAMRTSKEAQAANGNEGLTVNDVLPDWIRVRGYESDWAYPPGSVSWMPPQALLFLG